METCHFVLNLENANVNGWNKQIAALRNYLNGCPSCNDRLALIDAIYLLEAMRDQHLERSNWCPSRSERKELIRETNRHIDKLLTNEWYKHVSEDLKISLLTAIEIVLNKKNQV